VANRADVMVTDGIEADHQAYIHPELCPSHVAQPFTRLEKAYWLPKDPQLLAIVDKWLADEKASGNWDRILEVAQKAP
jgi:cyclohexadienyl dehydratase